MPTTPRVSYVSKIYILVCLKDRRCLPLSIMYLAMSTISQKRTFHVGPMGKNYFKRDLLTMIIANRSLQVLPHTTSPLHVRWGISHEQIESIWTRVSICTQLINLIDYSLRDANTQRVARHSSSRSVNELAGMSLLFVESGGRLGIFRSTEAPRQLARGGLKEARLAARMILSQLKLPERDLFAYGI